MKIKKIVVEDENGKEFLIKAYPHSSVLMHSGTKRVRDEYGILQYDHNGARALVIISTTSDVITNSLFDSINNVLPSMLNG